jgi:hypothetical protein
VQMRVVQMSGMMHRSSDLVVGWDCFAGDAR